MSPPLPPPENFNHTLGKKYDKRNIGLYRDDGLTVFKKISRPQAKRTKKEFRNFFKELGLKIEIKANLKVVDFLDVTFSLTTEMYCPLKSQMMNRPTGTSRANQIIYLSLSNTCFQILVK